MDGELKGLIKVCLSVLASLSYCHFIVSKIPKGKLRLLFLVPILCIFTLLPSLLSSVHLTAGSCFLITWLANFKLILFAFDQGPLASHPPKSFLSFVSIAFLPIKIKHDVDVPSPTNNLNLKYCKSNPSPPHFTKGKSGTKSPLKNLSIKALLYAILLRIYDYKQYLHRNLVITLYCCHVFLLLEFLLAPAAFLARALLGQELEPQSDEPYLSTSLQDFWGRRWNLMVTSILRPTVYDPMRSLSERVFGRKWASLPAVLAAFLVSALMHELIYYYATRAAPTGEVTCFFLLHGVCTALETVVKNAVKGRLQLHRAISRALTLGFVVATAVWLLFPPLVRNGTDTTAIWESRAVIAFVKEKLELRIEN
ncbi:PREDICTED: probable long-chain-alcohol O-fatty-acyltransferase 5 [Nelumbo nucifera]|uniref:Wax synthase domain-containing protein n=2 Tax=Nelumbo nucifera TaxID=4432 RepID=A0A822XFD9_NELNU|nr:PREDICTED: probable long-chain-alcohol O-fatty-acyltransferase 5 [Nelumbo nucifera]DAD17801.1 TPA_asm: hypothetical protein HUJ06_019264 [Nelumbo nucifera]